MKFLWKSGMDDVFFKVSKPQGRVQSYFYSTDGSKSLDYVETEMGDAYDDIRDIFINTRHADDGFIL